MGKISLKYGLLFRALYMMLQKVDYGGPENITNIGQVKT
jgi:hypothetical protein